MFDQVQGGWFAWDGKTFVPTKTPVLTKNFAGIGTRELTPAGRAGIRAAYALTQRAIEKAHAKPTSKTPEGKSINIYFGSGENAELSNLAMRPFTFEGVQYHLVEQAFQM